MDKPKIRPSALDMREKCPASAYFEKYGDRIETESADKGRKLHDWLYKGECPEEASNDEKFIFEKSIDQINFLTNQVKELHGEYKIFKEEEVQVFAGIEHICNGTADVIIETEKAFIVIDYKTGRNEVSGDTLQLQAYLIGAAQKFDAINKKLFAGICQPTIKGSISLVEYSYSQINKRLINLVDKIKNNPYQFGPSDKCRYCDFSSKCQALKMENKKAKEIASEITIENAAQFLDQYKIIKAIIDDAYKKCKDWVIEGLVDGWEVKEKSGRKAISDINAVYSEFKEEISSEEFVSLCTLSQTKFVDLAKRKLQERLKEEGEKITLKECEKRVKAAIAEYVVEGPKVKEIKKVKVEDEA